MSFFLRGNVVWFLLLRNSIWTQTFVFYWSVKRILHNVTKYNLPCRGTPCNWKILLREKDSRATHWGHTVSVCFCLLNLLTGLRLQTGSILNLFISQWDNRVVDGFECGTCLVMPKTRLIPSLYPFTGSLRNRMLMLDGMPAVRVKAEPLESEQGVREQSASSPPSILSFFFLLSLLLFLLSAMGW